MCCMKWVSVEDRLPYCGESVLVTYVDEEGHIEPEIDYMEYCVDTGVEYWANSGDLVTHWCPIPEPPEYHQPVVADKYTKAATESLEAKLKKVDLMGMRWRIKYNVSNNTYTPQYKYYLWWVSFKYWTTYDTWPYEFKTEEEATCFLREYTRKSAGGKVL